MTFKAKIFKECNSELLNDIARNQTKILLSDKARIFFFFLISNKYIYSRTLPYAEKHKAERKVKRERKRKKKKGRKRY